MTFTMPEMDKTLRNGLSMSEMDPLNHKCLDIAFSWDWHCTSLKKTAVTVPNNSYRF
jgi:hypothetical protein